MTTQPKGLISFSHSFRNWNLSKEWFWTNLVPRTSLFASEARGWNILMTISFSTRWIFIVPLHFSDLQGANIFRKNFSLGYFLHIFQPQSVSWLVMRHACIMIHYWENPTMATLEWFVVLSIELFISQTISVYSGRGEVVFEKNKSRTKLRKNDHGKDG